MGATRVKFGNYVSRERETLPFSGVDIGDNKLIVLFKPGNSYKGEFGFDWCEWNIETGNITKFQNTKASDIEYIFNDTEQQYKPSTNNNVQESLKLLYRKKTIGFGKQYYTPWMNLPKGGKATLQLTTIYLSKRQDAEHEEYITFKPNTDYDINYDGQLNNTIKIPLKKKNKATYNIEIIAKKRNRKYFVY